MAFASTEESKSFSPGSRDLVLASRLHPVLSCLMCQVGFSPGSRDLVLARLPTLGEEPACPSCFSPGSRDLVLASPQR